MAKDKELLFLPLGGSGEIGMNLNLYKHAGKWLMVDLGITFADDSLPGIDVLTPDTTFIEGERENLLALVLTHAHEDHLGAVPHLWDRLRCPVYATPFAAAVLERKLLDNGHNKIPITVVDYGEELQIGPFHVTYWPITHSIPEGSALTIRTGAGTVFHTGDWKFDPDPVIGAPTDEEHLRKIGDNGVLAMVCDSTNVFGEGESGSEGAVKESLGRLIAEREGRVVITTFSSNIARIRTAADIAVSTSRTLAVAGRSLLRMIESARAAGYLTDIPKVLRDQDIPLLPRDKVLLLCTGCQGEPRGAMSRIAFHDHPYVDLARGDTVIFSSKMIPGNERAIGTLCNRLVESGIEVLTERSDFVHVSGHPRREELKRMYGYIRPEIAVPVHGEAVHLAEHASLAESLGVPVVVTPSNGRVIRLAPGPVEVVDHVVSGRFAVDDGVLVPTDNEAIRSRRRLMHNGAVVVVMSLQTEQLDVRVSTLGIVSESGANIGDEIGAEIEDQVERLSQNHRHDADLLETLARRAINRVIRAVSQKRPLVDVQVFLPARQTRRLRKKEGVQ
ncbi:MAG: ribonuclease J [Proteobacteria bacterium]|nr:ribonuclease J [Pseudomonadota bacterium]MDA1058559.1 ribonuclease J [Pseudomonadota bacterium]